MTRKTQKARSSKLAFRLCDGMNRRSIRRRVRVPSPRGVRRSTRRQPRGADRRVRRPTSPAISCRRNPDTFSQIVPSSCSDSASIPSRLSMISPTRCLSTQAADTYAGTFGLPSGRNLWARHTPEPFEVPIPEPLQPIRLNDSSRLGPRPATGLKCAPMMRAADW